MIYKIAAAAALTLGTLAAPAMAEIVPAKCTLIRYGGMNTPPETFDCDFRQSGGNVSVNSKNWAFAFLAKNQGVTYIRINSQPLVFTRTGRYSLRIMQGPRAQR